MARSLVTTLHESCGYLQDEGWHHTARLMTLAAHEIERLSDRVHELESSSAAHERPLADIAPRIAPMAVASRRPR
jgi:DNA-directed RNA polymerase subunit F